MKTFNNYLEQKLIDKAAQKFCDLDIDADAFLKKWFENNHPEVAEILDENWWQGVKDAAGHAWQGAKAGGQAFARATFGPEAKFNAARSSLQGILDYVGKEPNLANWLKDSRGQGFTNQIGSIIKNLDNLKSTLPRSVPQQAKNQWQRQPNPQGQAQTAQANQPAPTNAQAGRQTVPTPPNFDDPNWRDKVNQSQQSNNQQVSPDQSGELLAKWQAAGYETRSGQKPGVDWKWASEINQWVRKSQTTYNFGSQSEN